MENIRIYILLFQQVFIYKSDCQNRHKIVMLAWPDLFKLNKLTHDERQKLNDFFDR